MDVLMLLFSYKIGIPFAYLDPGLGSFLFQIGLAVFMFTVYSIRSVIKKFFQFLKNTVTKLIRR